MIFKIVNKEANKYYLENKTGKKYEHSFKFFDLPTEPEIDDYIEIKDILLSRRYKEYNDIYLFGSLKQPYGREVKSKKDNDVILLIMKGKKYYLKRFFG